MSGIERIAAERQRQIDAALLWFIAVIMFACLILVASYGRALR